MLVHYVSTVMPDGFKAQLAATSRRAAVRYRDALMKARASLVAEIEALPETLLAGVRDGTIDIDSLDRRQQVLVRGAERLDLIRGAGIRSSDLRQQQ